MNDDDHEQPIPDADLNTVRMHYSATIAMAQAAVALQRARDLILCAHGSSTAAASVHVLHAAAMSLLGEMGSELVCTGRKSPDPRVRKWITLLLDRLHHKPATVPPQPPDEPPPA